MTDLRTQAEELHEQLSDHVEVDVDEVEGRLETLVGEYQVPFDEARRSVQSHYLDEADVDRSDLGGGSTETVTVEDIDEADRWIDIKAKVVHLWDDSHESIAQTGLIGDPTGRIKFTKWADADLPALEEDEVYSIRNAVTDEFQGRYSVKLNRTTRIEQLDEDIEVGDREIESEGAFVDVQSGSGLIKRCPEDDCTRVLQNGRCSEHGEGEGEFDLRIKGVLDDGVEVTEALFNREKTEELTGTTLEEAKDKAMDALDTTVVADEMRSQLIGRYYRVAGPTMGRYLLVNEFERLSGPADAEDVLIRGRSM